MAKFVWTTMFVALITMIAIAEIGEKITGIHIPWVMRLSIVLGVTVGYSLTLESFVQLLCTRVKAGEALSFRNRLDGLRSCRE